jgi:hypothetical protein
MCDSAMVLQRDNVLSFVEFPETYSGIKVVGFSGLSVRVSNLLDLRVFNCY